MTPKISKKFKKFNSVFKNVKIVDSFFERSRRKLN